MSKLLITIYLMSVMGLAKADEPTWTTDVRQSRDTNGYTKSQVCETVCQDSMCSTDCH